MSHCSQVVPTKEGGSVTVARLSPPKRGESGVRNISSCSQRRWSDPGSWPSGALPAEGEDVIISSRWRMLMDVTPPPLREVFVLGELMFEDQRDYNFTANLVGVRVCRGVV